MAGQKALLPGPSSERFICVGPDGRAVLPAKESAIKSAMVVGAQYESVFGARGTALRVRLDVGRIQNLLDANGAYRARNRVCACR